MVKLIEDPEFSSKAVPIYDLVYLASSPAAQVRRIPDIALKLAEPNQMQSQTRIVAEGIAVPNEYVFYINTGVIETFQFLGLRSIFN